MLQIFGIPDILPKPGPAAMTPVSSTTLDTNPKDRITSDRSQQSADPLDGKPQTQIILQSGKITLGGGFKDFLFSPLPGEDSHVLLILF